MSRRIAAAALAVAGLLCLLVGGPVAEAVEAPTSGWWSRLATTTPTDEAPAALPVPAPATPDTIPAGATVAEGQLLVESTPEGSTAVAAARWLLADGESSPSLTLPIGEGSTVNPQSVILACKAAAPWSPAESGAGSWETKPLVDAGRCVNGVIADDLMSVSFGVQPLLSGSELDVVLVAGTVADPEVPAGVPAPPVDADRSTFRWVFPAPTAESIAVVAGSDFEEGEGDVVVTPPPPPGPAVDLGPAPQIDVPAPSSITAPSPVLGLDEPVAAPALEPQDLAPSVPDVADVVEVAASSSVERTIGFVLLAAAAAMAAWAHLSNEQSTMIGLGRFRTAAAGAGGTVPPDPTGAVAPVVGGLSRFARERTTPPSRLA